MWLTLGALIKFISNFKEIIEHILKECSLGTKSNLKRIYSKKWNVVQSVKGGKKKGHSMQIQYADKKKRKC